MANTMETLRVKYTSQMQEYDRLIADAIRSGNVSQMPRIRALNVAIGKTLDEMITQITFLKKNTPSLKKERDDLVEKLERIQKEYNELAKNRDELETLRRIRQQESTEANRLLYLYLFAFLGVCIIILLVLLFMTQRKESTAPMASMPPTTAALV